MNRFKRHILLILSIIFILTSCNRINDQESGITAVTVLDEDMIIELMLGENEEENYFVVETDKEFSIADLLCVCEDSGVADIACNMTKVDNVIRFTVKAVGVGETEVYFGARGSNIISESVKIIVAEGESVTITTTVVQSTVQTDTVFANSTLATDSYVAENNNTTTSVAAADNSQVVYITPSGKKYHLSKSCAGANAIETTFQEASKSREPCKKCAK